MKKRYTITFASSLTDINEGLKQLRNIGLVIESSQPFIGSAIVVADRRQMEKAKELTTVNSITETKVFQVA